jgi:hypothetical protein
MTLRRCRCHSFGLDATGFDQTIDDDSIRT